MFGINLAPKLTTKMIPQVILVISPLLLAILATSNFIGTTKRTFLKIDKVGACLGSNLI